MPHIVSEIFQSTQGIWSDAAAIPHCLVVPTVDNKISNAQFNPQMSSTEWWKSLKNYKLFNIGSTSGIVSV